jgi:glycosyltransferase involved in cell wall biosynthesis
MISVIIPNYNHEQYLKQRIDSVLNQTYKDLECIILDDCSTDNSKDIIEEYRNHPKIKHIEYNVQNSGSTFKQWQKGISLAEGDYIWIAESDDWAEPDFLEKVLFKFKESTHIGLVYCNSNVLNNGVVTTTLSDVKIKILKNNKWASDYIYEGNDEIKDSLVLCCSINNASAVLFEKSILLKSNPFDLDFKYLGDWYCYLKIASISKIAYLNKPLNNYRDHSENVSKQATLGLNHLREYFLIYDWILKNISLKNKRQVMSFFDGFTIHSLALFDSDYRQKYRELWRINKKLFFHMIRFNFIVRIIPLLKRIKKTYFN